MGDTTVGLAGSAAPAQLADFVPIARAGLLVPAHLSVQDVLAAAYTHTNGIINGRCQIGQRNPLGITALVSGSLAYGPVDRIACGVGSGVSNAFAQHRGGLSAPGSPNGLRIGRNPGATSTGNIIASSIFESIDCYHLASKPCVFSFQAIAGANFSAAGGVISLGINVGAGVDQGVNLMIFAGLTAQTTPLSTTQALSAVWARYTFAFTPAANCTQLGWTIFYTPTGTAGADDSVYLTDFRLHPGFDLPSYMPVRPTPLELALCQRTYEKSYDQGAAPGTATPNGICTGSAPAATNIQGVRWKVEKRAVPTVNVWSRNGTAGKADAFVGVADTGAVTPGGTGTAGLHRLDLAGGGLTAGAVYEFHYAADAELN